MSGRKRQRASLACDACRRKKIRCDQQRPACQNCKGSKLQCSYSEHRRKTGPSKRPDVHSRLDRIEQLIGTLAGSRTFEQHQLKHLKYVEPEDSESESEGASDYASNDESVREEDDCGPSDEDAKKDDIPIFEQKMLRVQNCLDDCDLYTHGIGISMFTPRSMWWFDNRIGDLALTQKLRTSIQRMWSSQTAMMEEFVNEAAYPQPVDLEFLRACLLYYCTLESDFLSVLLTPLEARELADRNFNTIPPSGKLVALSAAVLITDWMGRRDVHANFKYSAEFLNQKKRLFLTNAAHVASTAAMVIPNMATLRGLAMVVMATSKSSVASAVIHQTSMLMGLATSMGLNRVESYRGLSEEMRERRKALWWILYSFDRDVAIKLGRSPYFTDSEVSTELFVCDPKSDLAPLKYIIELGRLYGKIYRRLFSVQAQTRNNFQHLQDVLSLSRDLGQWYDTIPDALRLDEEGNTKLQPLSLMDCSKMKFIYSMYTTYHQLRIIIFRLPGFSPSIVSSFLRKYQGRSPASTASCGNGSHPGSHSNGNYSNGHGNGPPSVGSAKDSPGGGYSVSDSDAELLTTALDSCADAARWMLRISEKSKPIGCNSLVSGAMFVLTGAFITLFIAAVARPMNDKSIADRELFRHYLSVFRLNMQFQEVEAHEETENHPMWEFWATLLEVLDKHYDKLKASAMEKKDPMAAPDAALATSIYGPNDFVPPQHSYSSSMTAQTPFNGVVPHLTPGGQTGSSFSENHSPELVTPRDSTAPTPVTSVNHLNAPPVPNGPNAPPANTPNAQFMAMQQPLNLQQLPDQQNQWNDPPYYNPVSLVPQLDATGGEEARFNMGADFGEFANDMYMMSNFLGY